ncbi:efflux transporter periplasmic adaptor subunit [Desulfobacter hydrogenophilus]|uniref:Efflux RND transporter periplasmic adaptor subunit n=1 Tax=Desulfobacter hydrogenophilus TaxID=2291 RepID=A0A328FD83_9BACT|nr:efflux RND transporter periplasmic adaptor subunit [Desulfobacter hydrogenophilus]NDY74195.1 efflux RND transporter periplasmic adaptor subunit [Desulfobacter hydrogenophilus]QBH12028.1 efflux RND transporter periplasmic adaptor subunit [Desulfobacter hydrogenophilus]RAM02611.1 efflux transporter periplasmic adaptor subunit [Desulfobacter hydrogenophilus]
MKKLPLKKRSLALIAVLVPLLALFIYVALRSGPLAPVSVVLATVENKSLSPALFGIGTIEARYTYKIGPTVAGRVKRLDVHVGDRVKAGQVLGEMDPVDLDEHIRAQDATLKQAAAQLNEAQVRRDYAQTQALRYEQLLQARSTSEEVVATKQHDLLVAKAGLTAAQEELSRLRAEREALAAQRNNLSLISPVNGLVVSRDAEPGTTVVPGQAVVELIDPDTLWVNVRFDQIRAQGLAPGLSAQIVLRSQAGEQKAGRVLRIEPLADAVTEETLAKVVFDQIPDPLPPVGELVEVTVTLPTLGATPIAPNAAIHHLDGRLGVWQVTHDDLHFTPVSLGIADLEGRVQIQKGLKAGDRIVVYSENTLNAHSRIHIVDHIQGVTQ